jgi:TonB family protein
MSAGSESDLGELAALFAAHSGGNFSAEVSADLALEIVLNEIVEQACLATGATGAAIILERDGEMVCRASSGVNAPEFGSRLGSESGLTAECIRTRQVQRCEDALTDPRADAEASRSLGVRSVLILPLLRNGSLAGLLEIFSSHREAFRERDELTVEALAQRVLKNLERASDAVSMSSIIAAGGLPIPAAKVDPAIAARELEDPAGSATSLNREEDITAETLGRSPRARIDVVTVALGAAVIVCAVLLTALVVLRVSSRRTADVREQRVRPASSVAVEQNGVAPSGAAQIAGELASSAVSSPASSKAGNSTAAAEKKNGSAPDTGTVRSKESSPPEGGLLVYENGKEVFRIPPARDSASVTSANASGVQQAADLEPEGIVVVSQEAAEGSLLHRVEPEYPEEARQQHIQGSVELDVRIGRDGTIQEVKVVSGHRILADAAIAAVKQWRFKPRTLKGEAVEMQTRVTLNFRMPG